MINSQRLKARLWLKGIVLSTSPTSQCFRLLQHYPPPTLSLKFSTIASSGNHSFTVSYLITNLGFSQEAALKASKTVRFEAAQKPDAAVSFFRSRGFSESQINDLVKRLPSLLLCDPHRSILPKFEFLLSKGASTTDISSMVCKNPRFLLRSLENHIIPSYGFFKGFFKNDKATVDCIRRYPYILQETRLIRSINLLLKNGVSGTNIGLILYKRPRALQNSSDIMKVADEVKAVGFSPLKTQFGVAVVAKMSVSKSNWEAKVDVHRRWGWSEEALLKAFRKQPHCMLASNDKINAVMRIWVNQLGWNSLLLVEDPRLFGYSLNKRTVPRGWVLRYLHSKGLISKNSCLCFPFSIPEKQFLERFVNCFEEPDDQILKLYEENLKNDGMSCA